MPSSRFARTLAVVGLAVASALATVTTARAAVVVASFDPAFGAGIPNLGFKGSANLDIADTCFSNVGLVLNGNFGCTLSVLSAQVQFYNLATPATVFSTLNFAGTSANYFNVLAGFFAGGQITGLDTTFSAPGAVALQDDIGGLSPIDFSGFLGLNFYTGLLVPGRAAGPQGPEGNDAGFVPGIGGAQLLKCTDGNALDSDFPQCVGSVPSDLSNPATLTFSTVPEPASMALALLALGAAGAARRRRQV